MPRALVLVDTVGAVGDGGLAAFAERLIARISPQTVARLAMLDDLAGATANPAEADAAALESLWLRWPGYFADPSVAPAPLAGLRVSRACYTRTFKSVSAAQAEDFLPSLLARLSGQVEIVAGNASRFPADFASSTRALFRSGNVTLVDGTGHFPWIERPAGVAAALRQITAGGAPRRFGAPAPAPAGER